MLATVVRACDPPRRDKVVMVVFVFAKYYLWLYTLLSRYVKEVAAWGWKTPG